MKDLTGPADIFVASKINVSNAIDVFLKRFDRMWAENSDLFQIKEWTTLHREGIDPSQDDGSIVYKYNDEYFRCDNFTVKHDNLHVLFAGCSVTEGVGLKIEDTWSYLLNKDIKNSDGFFNLARAGWGYQKIISNFLIYVKQYGKPDYFFLLMPNSYRRYKWITKEEKWEYQQRFTEEEINGMDKLPEQHDFKGLTEEEYFDNYIDFIMAMDFLQEYCNSNNIKFLWSTWYFAENNMIYRGTVLAKINSFIPVNQKEFTNYAGNDFFNLKITDDLHYRARDGHPGPVLHKFIYEKFKKEIIERGWDVF